MNGRLTACLAAAAALVACAPPEDPVEPTWTWTLDVDGVPELEEGTYIAWLEGPSGNQELGSFTAATSLEVDAPVDPADYSSARVTLHAPGDPTDAPSGITVLQTSSIQESVPMDFPIDLLALEGTYSLWSPTDGVEGNDEAGLWFLQKTEDEMMLPSLSLPEAPPGWAWEGWVTTQGVLLSTGRFATADGADSGCPYCADLGEEPMLPGEDFVAGLPPGIEGEVDLSDGSSTVLVSLEPDDVGTDPFGVDPFGIIAIGADIPLGLDGTTDAPIAPGDFSTSLEAVLGYAASDTD